jgi:hypothetical protein
VTGSGRMKHKQVFVSELEGTDRTFLLSTFSGGLLACLGTGRSFSSFFALLASISLPLSRRKQVGTGDHERVFMVLLGPALPLVVS